jgi:hypothetical protein
MSAGNWDCTYFKIILLTREIVLFKTFSFWDYYNFYGQILLIMHVGRYLSDPHRNVPQTSNVWCSEEYVWFSSQKLPPFCKDIVTLHTNHYLCNDCSSQSRYCRTTKCVNVWSCRYVRPKVIICTASNKKNSANIPYMMSVKFYYLFHMYLNMYVGM